MCVPGQPDGKRPEPHGSGMAKDATVAPCPRMDGRWVDTRVYCGDFAKLEARISPAPGDCKVQIYVWRTTDRGPLFVEVFEAGVRGGRIEAQWTAKAPSARWREDRLFFSVLMSGSTVAGQSSNALTFKARPDIGWKTLDRNLPKPPPTWYASKGQPKTWHHFREPCEICDATFDAAGVHYELRLKITGVALTAEEQGKIQFQVEDIWNGNFKALTFHRLSCQRGAACDCTYDCCKAGYKLSLRFVSGGEHVTVDRKVGTGQAHMGRKGSEWYVTPIDPDAVYAHEVGHVLGQYDERAEGSTDPTGEQPPSSGEPNIMAYGNFVAAGAGRLLPRHYRWALKFLNDHADGDKYETRSKA